MMEKIIKYKTFGRLKENTHREEKNTHANFVMLKTNHGQKKEVSTHNSWKIIRSYALSAVMKICSLKMTQFYVSRFFWH